MFSDVFTENSRDVFRQNEKKHHRATFSGKI